MTNIDDAKRQTMATEILGIARRGRDEIHNITKKLDQIEAQVIGDQSTPESEEEAEPPIGFLPHLRHQLRRNHSGLCSIGRTVDRIMEEISMKIPKTLS